jgi:hypothetical protein
MARLLQADHITFDQLQPIPSAALISSLSSART